MTEPEQSLGEPTDLGRPWRRATAGAAATLGAVDVVQAVSRHAITRLGDISLHLGGSTTRFFRYALLVAALILLSAARGLLRGKRVAWALSLAATAASVVGHYVVKADVGGIVVALVVGTVLLIGATHFRAQPDPILARQGVLWLVVGVAATYAYGVAGLFLLDGDFRRSRGLGQSLGEAARLLFLLPASTFEPSTRLGAWFINSVRVLIAVVLLIGLARLLHSVTQGTTQHEWEIDRVRHILNAHATTALAHFHLLDDKHHLFSADGEAFLGYKVVGSVAIVLGEPVGDPGACQQVVGLFLERCRLNGWLPAFHQVTPAGVALLTELGLKALKIGEEAVIDVTSFSLQGSHFKSLRSKTGKLEREGWTVEELHGPTEPQVLARLRQISDAWLDSGGHRERTFTLGRFDERSLRDTTVLVALDPERMIQAFVTLVPTYKSLDGNFDLMRRPPDAHNSVMDLLFVRMIARFRAEGRHGLSLGLAPLSGIDGSSMTDRALRVIYERGGNAFNFRGLRAFKEKWRPDWEPRYLVYRHDSELAQVAFATSRAGELPHPVTGRAEIAAGWTGAVARGLVNGGRRLPFTAFVTTVLVLLQLGTQIDSDAYPEFRARFTYNWSDLARHGQFYRVITATFVQDGHGIRLGILGLVPLLAIAEYVLRTRRAVIAFFLGDLASSLPILAIERLAAALGSHSAALHAAERDGGTSSAMFGAVAAAALAIPHPRVRRYAIAALALFLVAPFVILHRLLEFEHLCAAAIGTACWWTWTHRDLEVDALPDS